MSFVRLIALLLILECTDASLGSAQQGRTPQPLPIIDMHIHAFSWNHQGNPPPPNPVTGKVPTAHTDNEAMEASLAELRRYNVVRAVAGGPREHVLRWLAAEPKRIIGGTMMGPRFPLPDVSVLREDFRAGRLGVWYTPGWPLTTLRWSLTGPWPKNWIYPLAFIPA